MMMKDFNLRFSVPQMLPKLMTWIFILALIFRNRYKVLGCGGWNNVSVSCRTIPLFRLVISRFWAIFNWYLQCINQLFESLLTISESYQFRLAWAERSRNWIGGIAKTADTEAKSDETETRNSLEALYQKCLFVKIDKQYCGNDKFMR